MLFSPSLSVNRVSILFKVLLRQSMQQARVHAGLRGSDLTATACCNGAHQDIQLHHQQDCICNAHPNTTLLLLFETNVNAPVAVSRSGQSSSSAFTIFAYLYPSLRLKAPLVRLGSSEPHVAQHGQKRF